MSFFSKLAFIAGELDLQITFKKKGDKITVGVFPSHSNKELSEKIKPITLTGTAAELDEGFLAMPPALLIASLNSSCFLVNPSVLATAIV